MIKNIFIATCVFLTSCGDNRSSADFHMRRSTEIVGVMTANKAGKINMIVVSAKGDKSLKKGDIVNIEFESDLLRRNTQDRNCFLSVNGRKHTVIVNAITDLSSFDKMVIDSVELIHSDIKDCNDRWAPKAKL